MTSLRKVTRIAIAIPKESLRNIFANRPQTVAALKAHRSRDR